MANATFKVFNLPVKNSQVILKSFIAGELLCTRTTMIFFHILVNTFDVPFEVLIVRKQLGTHTALERSDFFVNHLHMDFQIITEIKPLWA